MTGNIGFQFRITDPTSGDVIETFTRSTADELEAALDSAQRSQPRWAASDISARSSLLTRVAGLYEARRDDLAKIVVREVGKPIAQAQFEIDLVAAIYRYYADAGAAMMAAEELDTPDAGRVYVEMRPIGTILGIMPWNFPYYQLARLAAPNLILANAVLHKPAPQCPGSARAMQEIFDEAGLPSGVFATVLADSEQVASLIADDRVSGVSLTGSERAGAAVAEIAGAHLKKVVLELGGSDPLIVVNPVNVDDAVADALASRFLNTGQACNCAKRLIVVEDLYDEFSEKFASRVARISLGDPLAPDTEIGPMASAEAAARLYEQVSDAIERGARVVGGVHAEPNGAWYQPVVLACVTPAMRAYHEELFGPVAVLYRASDVDEAVALANATKYGLGATIECADIDKALSIGSRIESGMVFINEPTGTAPHLPFGGVKRSGIGRELGPRAVEEFANKKLIKIAAKAS